MNDAPRLSRGRKALLAFGSLLVALLLGEIVVRQVVENPITGIERTRVGWKAHGFIPDAELEYAFEPGVQSRMVLPDNYDVPFRINAQGLRDDVEFAREHPGTTRVLLVGDSYVFGVGVELQDTIGKQLQALLTDDPAWGRPTEVVAIGAPSYGLDTYAKIIDRWSPRLLPDLVLVAVFPGNDLIDYEQKAAHPATVVGGYIVSGHEAWSFHLRRISTLAHMLLETFNPHPRVLIERPGRPTPEQLAHLHDTMRPWIERIAAACARAGPGGGPVPLAVTLMHGRSGVAAWREGRLGFRVQPIAEVLDDFRAAGATILDPKPAWIASTEPVEACFHRTDGHYSVIGSRLVARYLAESLREAFAAHLPR
jgi:hypothetical protein